MSKAIVCDFCGRNSTTNMLYRMFKIEKIYLFYKNGEELDICSDCWYSLKKQATEKCPNPKS